MVTLLEPRLKATNMRKTPLFLVFATIAACAPTSEFIRELPDEVVALAAPNQNLQAVKLLEDDSCYWYEHDGPVERTLLPLVSARGRQICVQRES